MKDGLGSTATLFTSSHLFVLFLFKQQTKTLQTINNTCLKGYSCYFCHVLFQGRKGHFSQPSPITKYKFIWAASYTHSYLVCHPSCQLCYAWTLLTWGHKGSLTSSVLNVTTYITVSCRLSLPSLFPIHTVTKCPGCQPVTRHIRLK